MPEEETTCNDMGELEERMQRERIPARTGEAAAASKKAPSRPSATSRRSSKEREPATQPEHSGNKDEEKHGQKAVEEAQDEANRD